MAKMENYLDTANDFERDHSQLRQNGIRVMELSTQEKVALITAFVWTIDPIRALLCTKRWSTRTFCYQYRNNVYHVYSIYVGASRGRIEP